MSASTETCGPRCACGQRHEHNPVLEVTDTDKRVRCSQCGELLQPDFIMSAADLPGRPNVEVR